MCNSLHEFGHPMEMALYQCELTLWEVSASIMHLKLFPNASHRSSTNTTQPCRLRISIALSLVVRNAPLSRSLCTAMLQAQHPSALTSGSKESLSKPARRRRKHSPLFWQIVALTSTPIRTQLLPPTIAYFGRSQLIAGLNLFRLPRPLLLHRLRCTQWYPVLSVADTDPGRAHAVQVRGDLHAVRSVVGKAGRRCDSGIYAARSTCIYRQLQRVRIRLGAKDGCCRPSATHLLPTRRYRPLERIGLNAARECRLGALTPTRTVLRVCRDFKG